MFGVVEYSEEEEEVEVGHLVEEEVEVGHFVEEEVEVGYLVVEGCGND